MSGYYCAIIFLCLFALGVLCLLVHENARIRRRDKGLLYLTYVLIAVSALAEFCGVYLSGREYTPSFLLQLVKCADYILTPMAGGALIYQMRMKNRWNHVVQGLLVFNMVLQVVCAFGGWMVVIDDSGRYKHGPLYVLYVVIYLAIILIVLLQFILYGRTFRRQNRASLYAIILLAIAGIAIQEFSGINIRTSYLSLTMAASMLYIHYTEYTSLEMDDHLKNQQLQLDTDALTGVLSRYAYTKALKSYAEAGALPKELTAFTVDINGLKQTNDTLGHEAGDELIRGAAECVVTALNAEGKCYRTGGDEFVVLTEMDKQEARNALKRLKREARRWRGSTARSLSVSAGFALASDHAGMTAEALVRESDKAMYKVKTAYYQQAGRDRRKQRQTAGS